MTINDDFTREMLFTPADAEAERLAVAEHEPRYTAEGRDGFAFGFAAGLAHARKWRALTDAPETWPEEGHRVLFHWQNGATGIGQRAHATRDMILWDGYEYPIHRISEARAWLPLPAPPEVTP